MEVGKSGQFTYLGYEEGKHIFYNADTDERVDVADDMLYGVSVLQEKALVCLNRARLNCYVVSTGGL